MRDQRAAQHLLGFFGGLFNRLGQTDTALFTGVGLFERTFAAAARVDLCLYDPQGAIQFTGCGFGFLSAQNRATFGDRSAIAAEERLWPDIRECSSKLSV